MVMSHYNVLPLLIDYPFKTYSWKTATRDDKIGEIHKYNFISASLHLTEEV